MLHGEVGTGKSMLVDLFADCLPHRKKRRWHFNAFMLDTFSRLEHLRKSRSVVKGENLQDEYSLLWLARDLIQTSPILFLDEFQLPDRAASKILSNLMTSFFQLGGVLIATSNRMPEELAKAAGIEFARPVSRLSRLGWTLGIGGLVGRDDGPGQAGEFAQFLEVLRARCEVWEMEGKKDYRRVTGGEDRTVGLKVFEDLSKSTSVPAEGIPSDPISTGTAEATPSHSSETTLPKHYFITPSSTASPTELATHETTLDVLLHDLTSTPHHLPILWAPTTLIVYGRPLHIPAQYAGNTLFTFSQLCGATLGPADYITLASTYHTLILTDIPIFSFAQKNEARRLITLLDALYEARCRLLITAAASPDHLFFPSSPSSASPTPDERAEALSADAVHPETYSEIHQDLTSPFRPNVSSYHIPALSADALEDDPPNRVRRPGSSYTDERKLSAKAPDFANIGGLTGEDEKFAVKRAQSRMWELCSRRWWERASASPFDAGAGEEGRSWWRPLPPESRHWERPSRFEPVADASAERTHVSEISDAHLSADRDPRMDKQQGTFAHGASPFRTTSDPPPNIGWTHV